MHLLVQKTLITQSTQSALQRRVPNTSSGRVSPLRVPRPPQKLVHEVPSSLSLSPKSYLRSQRPGRFLCRCRFAKGWKSKASRSRRRTTRSSGPHWHQQLECRTASVRRSSGPRTSGTYSEDAICSAPNLKLETKKNHFRIRHYTVVIQSNQEY